MKEMAKQPKRKKVCIIATAAVLTVALALGVWALFFRAPQRQWVIDQKYEEKLADLEEQAQIEINQGYFLK